MIFEDYNSEAIQIQLRKVLLKAKNDSVLDISFSCGIVPISKEMGDVHQLLQAAEHAVREAQKKEPLPVKIVAWSNENSGTVNKEIILIDSDKDLIDLLKMTFESHGFTVKTFAYGEEALNTLLSYNEDHLPALIISERKLPDIEGIEILKRLKSRFRQAIPFYFLTVYASDKDLAEGIEQGVSEYIVKPFNLSLLVQKAMSTIFQHVKTDGSAP
jgi:CheY-like chemotaxis protein